MNWTAIPHTFDTDALLAYAQKTLKRRHVRQSELYFSLLERTGVAIGQWKTWDEAETLFRRGLKEGDNLTEQARFKFLIGFHGHFRNGDYREAKRYLTEAVKLSEGSRNLRTQSLLALARANGSLHDYDAADQSLLRVLKSGVLKYRPAATAGRAILKMQQGLFEEAVSLNRKAHTAYKRARAKYAMRLADNDLGCIYLTAGKLQLAKKCLEGAAKTELELLNVDLIGCLLNNLCVVYQRMGDWKTAQEKSIQALRFHTVAGRKHFQSGTYRNLGNCLRATGDLETALAAYQKAIALAKEIGNADRELQARSDAIAAILDKRARTDVLPALIAGGRKLVEAAGTEISNSALVEYSVVASRLAISSQKAKRGRSGAKRGRSLATPKGLAALKSLTGRIREDEYDRLLLDRLGDGLSGRFAPRPEAVRSFLMLYAGDQFRFGNYAAEFVLTTSRAKPQLRELCERRIVALSGTRKAAKYTLSFHRA